MSRRRLRLLTYSSSDEDDTPRQHHNQRSTKQDTDSTMQEASGEVTMAEAALASTTLNPNPSYDFPSPPMEISDNELETDEVFVDVSVNLSPPSPSDDLVQEEAIQPSVSANSVSPPSREYSVAEETFEPISDDVGEEGDVGLIRGVLSRLGLRLKLEWVASCLRGLENSVSEFGSFSVNRKAELCFGQFLVSDMNYSGAGGLPENVGGMHMVDLAGPFVLQVDEIVNISCPLRQRYHKAAPGNKRCLKLSMTNGTQRVFGMEYRPIKDLDVLAPAGLKIAIRNVHVRHGLLMIVPEVIEVLGGMVEELEAAHQRLVAEINKPPRGRRPRMGNIIPLATKATHAAWPSAFNSGPEPTLNSRPQNSDTVQAPIGVGAHSHSFSHRFNDPSAPIGMRGGDHPNPIFHLDVQATRRGQQHHSRVMDGPPLQTRATPSTCPSVGAIDSVTDNTQHFRPQHSNFLRTSDSGAHGLNQALHSGTQTADAEISNVDIDRDSRSTSNFTNEDNRETIDFNRRSNTSIEDIDMTDDIVETLVRSRSIADMDQLSNPVGNTEDPNRPLMLPGNQEIPFTYLTSLSAELLAEEDGIASVKGKIKCFITGVKTFQYQGRKTYELWVFVEDGSLISEILIDHSVVQDRVGYSPMEVNAAISSSDANIVSRMKEIMKQFRSFLVNFEGTMTVELKKSSSTPVAIEMTQGCPSSDAWLLLRRVKSYFTTQPPQSSEPILLSP